MLRGDTGDDSEEGDVGIDVVDSFLWTEGRRESGVVSSDEMGLDEVPEGARIDTGDTGAVGGGTVRIGEGGTPCDRK